MITISKLDIKLATYMDDNQYELRVNDQVKCTFTNKNKNNLVQCLRLAADAYEKYLEAEQYSFFNGNNKIGEYRIRR